MQHDPRHDHVHHWSGCRRLRDDVCDHDLADGGGMSEMVERIAKHIERQSSDYEGQPFSMCELYARWALEAMREPPLEMRIMADDLADVVKAAGLPVGATARIIWQDMIDEALK